jgi:hypothetical protein
MDSTSLTTASVAYLGLVLFFVRRIRDICRDVALAKADQRNPRSYAIIEKPKILDIRKPISQASALIRRRQAVPAKTAAVDR